MVGTNAIDPCGRNGRRVARSSRTVRTVFMACVDSDVCEAVVDAADPVSLIGHRLVGRRLVTSTVQPRFASASRSVAVTSASKMRQQLGCSVGRRFPGALERYGVAAGHGSGERAGPCLPQFSSAALVSGSSTSRSSPAVAISSAAASCRVIRKFEAIAAAA